MSQTNASRQARPKVRTPAGIARITSTEYVCWQNLKKRCLNKSHRQYANYGGRGITVAAEWIVSFEAFLAYVGRKPSPELSLDRIDNDGNYEPGNVRWASPRLQASNQRAPTRKYLIPANDQLYSKCWEVFAC